jgi:hypothetical protein
LDRRLGGPQNQPERFKEQKKLAPTATGIRTLAHEAIVHANCAITAPVKLNVTINNSNSNERICFVSDLLIFGAVTLKRNVLLTVVVSRV